MAIAGMAACSDDGGDSGSTAAASGDTSAVSSRIETTTPVPSDYFNTAEEQGTVEVLTYSSRDYTSASLSATQKPAYIYLPYGYDANKKYDIIYLMHGWTGTAQEYFGLPSRQQMKNLFDNMIEHHLCRPFIAVSPTWDKDNRAKNWSESTDEIAVFYHEYENDLIPAVESRYSTYAQSTDRDGIIASRDHRAFGGFSLGAITTWYIFEHSFPLQRYFLPMSGDNWHVAMFGGASRPVETAAFLATVVDSSEYKNAFHVWHAVGSSDVRYAQTHNQGMAMMQLPEFGPATYSYHERPNGQHDFNSVWEFCYNALPFFFPINDDKNMKDSIYYNVNTPIDSVTGDPAFGDYGRLLVPVDEGYWSGNTLGNIRLIWYHNIDANKTVEIANYLRNQVARGDTVFYNIYTEAERAADTEKRNTGLFFFRAHNADANNAPINSKDRPFAICNAGGGFAYVGAIHDSFPHALELSKQGYNAFALIYRPDYAYADLARAIEYIFDHADEIGVNTDDYSLWGGSAGARMAATLGNSANLRSLTHRTDLPQAAAVIMQYTGYSTVSPYDAPTYACVGTSDGIASWRTMQTRLQQLQDLGIPTEFHSYAGLQHGFGLGTGTVAEGWIDDAINFWQRQRSTTAIHSATAYAAGGSTSVANGRAIYGLDGRHRNSLHRGINILNGKKIIIK